MNSDQNNDYAFRALEHEFPTLGALVALSRSAETAKKRFSSVAKRFLISARSAFESGKVSQALRDCACVLAWLVLGAAGFVAVFGSFIVCLLFRT